MFDVWMPKINNLLLLTSNAFKMKLFDFKRFNAKQFNLETICLEVTDFKNNTII